MGFGPLGGGGLVDLFGKKSSSTNPGFATTPIQHPAPSAIQTAGGLKVGAPAPNGVPATKNPFFAPAAAAVTAAPAVPAKPPASSAKPTLEPKNVAVPSFGLAALNNSAPVSGLGASGSQAPVMKTGTDPMVWMSNHKGLIALTVAGLAAAFFFVLKK